MLNAKRYLEDLTAVLREKFGERLVYVGLQGSYLRGEATEESDIDIMVVVEDLQVEDLAEYRAAIEGLECPEKSCGFLCGKEDLLGGIRWRSVICCTPPRIMWGYWPNWCRNLPGKVRRIL